MDLKYRVEYWDVETEEWVRWHDQLQWDAVLVDRALWQDITGKLEALEAQNANLLRINRERANAERDLRPKKQHTGYVFLSSINPRPKDRRYTTVLQTPYTLEYPRDMVLKNATEDLNGDIGKKLGLERKLTVAEIQTLGPMATVGRNEPEQITLRANGRNGGYWEVVFQHQEPINSVPADMLPREK